MSNEIKKSLVQYFHSKKYSTHAVKNKVDDYMHGRRPPKKQKRQYFLPLIATAVLLLLVSTLAVSQYKKEEQASEEKAELTQLKSQLEERENELQSIETAKNELESQLENKEEELGSILSENEQLKTQIDELKQSQADAPAQHPFTHLFMEEFGISREQMPELLEMIKDSMIANEREIIPYEGVLGGTFKIVRSSINILSHEWAFAEFEDGHVAGMLLLKYNHQDDGSIAWELVDVYPEPKQ